MVWGRAAAAAKAVGQRFQRLQGISESQEDYLFAAPLLSEVGYMVEHTRLCLFIYVRSMFQHACINMHALN